MPETILGLDIGMSAVKAVLANSRGRADVFILAAETVKMENGLDLETAITKIAETILPLASSKVRCVVTLPPADVMFRQVQLPFHDDGKIKKTLSFELEPLLPVPIEEVVIDYLRLPDAKLLAAVCGKERIRKVITAVEAHLGKVIVIDIGASALVSPFLAQKALTGSGLALDIGASSTSAAFYEDHALLQIRSFNFGGDTITSALSGDLSCDAIKAEQIKIAGADTAKTDGAMAACREFCVALANTVEFLRLNDILKSAPVQIMLTGGGSLFKPLGDELAQKFGAAVTVADFSKSGRLEISEKLQGRYSPPVMNTALAAVKRSSLPGKSFNFRQGEFAMKSVPSDIKTQLLRGAIIAVILALLTAVDLFLGYRWQASQTAGLKKQITAIFNKHYPPSAAMVDPLQQLRTKLEDDRKMYGMDNSASEVTTLEILKDLSDLIPPALDVIVTHVHYENRNLLLKGEAKKMDDVTDVKNGLLKSKFFKNVAIGATALAKEGDKVNFDLRIELR
jgi:general secretion pathway protein L